MKLVLLITLFLSISTHANDGIFCKGKFYILDYLQQVKVKPFGELHKPSDIHPKAQRFAHGIIMNAIIQRFASEITPSFNAHFDAFLSSNDKIQWQKNELGFPTQKARASEFAIPKECWDKDGYITIHPIVKESQQGSLIAFEFNPKLVKLLNEDGLQLSFLFIGSFLRQYSQNQIKIAELNWFFHARAGIYSPVEMIRGLFFKAGVLSNSKNSEYCQLGFPLQSSLVNTLKFPCEDILEEDLLELKHLTILAPSSEVWYNIKQGDFNNLSHLSSLELNNFGSSINRISLSEFQQLKQLRKFSIKNSSIENLSQEMINGLKNITHIDLSKNDFIDFKADSFSSMLASLDQAPTEVVINLSHNPIVTTPRKYGFISPGAFRGAEAVTHLYLKDMQLRSLKPEVFDHFVRLRELDISYNYISRLKNALSSQGLNSLEKLNMEKIGLKRFTKEDISALRNLKELNLGFNRLRDFPYFIFQIKTLKKLTFCSRHIKNEQYPIIMKRKNAEAPNLKIHFCEMN